MGSFITTPMVNTATLPAPIVSNYLSTRNEIHFSPQRQIITPVSNLPVTFAQQPQINQVFIPQQTSAIEFGNSVQPAALLS